MGSFNCIFENNSLKALFGQNIKKLKILKLSPDSRYLQKLALKKLQKCGKKLGAKSLDYSKWKNSKYFIELDDGEKVLSRAYQDYWIHGDEERRKKYISRARNVQNKSGELT